MPIKPLPLNTAKLEAEAYETLTLTNENIFLFERRFDRGLYGNCRFGQAFCNVFSVSDDPRLWNSLDRLEASGFIYTFYFQK